MANVLKWLKNIMSWLHCINNILLHGINPGENIDSMADEVKNTTANIYNHFVSCMFKRCIFIRILVLRTYSYLRIPLNGRFVFPYFSYSLCIFIFHVFRTSSINHEVALCKNSVNDVCKNYAFIIHMYMHSTYNSMAKYFFFQKIAICYSAA